MTASTPPSVGAPFASSPAVSILMPVYNAQRYVEAAVNSILDQTFSDFELVIVNDGSTDGTLGILERLAARDPRINLITQPNMGIQATLNAAALAARAPLLARMDADDISLPTRLQLQVRYLNEHPECVAVGTKILTIDPDGVAIAEMFLLTGHDQIDRANLAGECAMAHPSIMIRRSALDIFPPYRTDYAEDLDLWLRLGERGRLANLPDVLLKYRLHPASATHSAAYVKRQIFEQVLADADRRRGRVARRAPIAPDKGRPISTTEAPWLWCRMALSAGNYQSARLLARKAAAGGLNTSGAITLGLAFLGPIGRAMLKFRQRRAVGSPGTPIS